MSLFTGNFDHFNGKSSSLDFVFFATLLIALQKQQPTLKLSLLVVSF